MTTSALASVISPAPRSMFHRLLASPLPNPDFAVTHEEAAVDMERMRASPVVPRRPVMVLAGYHAWSLNVHAVARTMHSLVGGPSDYYSAMAYPLTNCIETMARRVVRQVGRTWPHDEPHRTAEIDVIGVSMGGIVARLAAQLPLVDGQKRLRIVRLFTLGTPHRGALLADGLPRWLRDKAACDLRSDSRLIERLNAALPTSKYDLVCYARLNDKWTGAQRSSPPHREPYWVDGLKVLSHTTMTSDPRILVDIARRLRGEEPMARRATAPPTN